MSEKERSLRTTSVGAAWLCFGAEQESAASKDDRYQDPKQRMSRSNLETPKEQLKLCAAPQEVGNQELYLDAPVQGRSLPASICLQTSADRVRAALVPALALSRVDLRCDAS